MPRIVVTSDLHLGITTAPELAALAGRIAAEQPDLTVLAGDIGEGLPNIRACLRIFEGVPGEVAVLMGNHDLWARGHDSQTLWNELLPQAVRDAGMIWLEASIWRSDAVAVVGSMAWYDYTGVDPIVPPRTNAWFARHKRKYNVDAFYINWRWSDPEFAHVLSNALFERMRTLEDDPAARAVLVVTHVPLFRVQMFYKPGDLRWGTGSAYFGNMTLGEHILPMSKLRHVVSGHTHIGRAGMVERPDLPPIPAWVVPSDYHKPAYLTIESDNLLT
jgi:Calcineurin-like phosphoesterase